jgi:hypothetical protein
VWGLTFALLACLCIDFSNPLLPGVVRFGEDESVHALRAERSRMDERPTRTLPRPPAPARSVDVDPSPLRSMTGRLDRVHSQAGAGRPRGAIDTAPAAPTSVEDH